ncbi:MAG: DUF1499 domain-containing protein [Pseudomonadota bacterium]
MFVIYILAAAIVAFVIYVRIAPSNPSIWHVDPATVSKTAKPNQYLLSAASSADGPAPTFALSPDALSEKLDTVARSEGATVLAGSATQGHVTYVVRTKTMAYPDYISVRVSPEGEGAKLDIYSRSRFGRSDLGVNKARVRRWLKKIGLGE